MDLNSNASVTTGIGTSTNGTIANYTTVPIISADQIAKALLVDTAPDPIQDDKTRWQQIADLYGEIAPTEWIIENVIPEESCVLMYGESGTGKSFLAVHWAMQAAHAGRVVVYHAAEGRKAIAKRFYAAGRVMGFPPPPNLILDNGRIDLLDAGSVRTLIAAMQNLPTKPDMLILDTLATVTSGYNDNDSQQTGIALENIRLIRDVIGCSVLVVHHKPKDARATPRGSGRLRDDNDVCIDVAHHGDPSSRELVVTCAKMKDDDLFQPHYYRREVTAVATVANRAGAMIDITSCYLQPTMLADIPLNPKSDPLTPTQREVYDLILSYGKGGCGMDALERVMDKKDAYNFTSILIKLGYVTNKCKAPTPAVYVANQ